jgi:hypothetical protein
MCQGASLRKMTTLIDERPERMRAGLAVSYDAPAETTIEK